MPTILPGSNPLSYLGVEAENPPTLITEKRAPTSSDTKGPEGPFLIGTLWVDRIAGIMYALTTVSGGVASWTLLGSGSSDLEFLTGDTGGALLPTAGNINILGGDGLTVDGTASTLTINRDTEGGYPITPFVVGPSGQAGFTTIQAGLNAANAAGGGIVYVQPDTYIENLTLFGNTEVVAVSANSDSNTVGNDVIITGVHVPPASGSFVFKSILLTSATDIFSSAVVGTADLILENCIIAVTNGYLFNVLNWTGNLIVYNLGDASTNNGVVNNTGGATCFFVSATLGNGSGQTMNTTGVVDLQEVHLKAPWNAQTGTVINCPYVTFDENVTLSNDSTGEFFACQFSTGANAALTMSSSGTITLTNSSIDSSNSPSITGAGAGVLTVVGCSFLQDREFAGTLTLASGELRGAGQLTRFVVGATPDAPYQTIQAALNAANAAGGGIVYVQPDTYVENLTLFGNTEVVSVSANSDSGTVGNDVTITGVHVPPASGSFVFKSILLTSATDIFSSAVVGTADLILENCIIAVTNGYLFNVLNWTGNLIVYNLGDASTNNGVVNNTGGATCFFVSATLGNGTGQTMNTTGSVDLQEVHLKAPWNAQTGTVINCPYVTFDENVTLSNDSTGEFFACQFSTGASAALTMSSSGTITLTNSSIDSSNSPSITGAGAGALTVVGCSFLQDREFAGTLTLASGELRGAGQLTRFVVGAAPDAPYQTIQAALDAANAAGGGIVYVQPDTYVENLTLFGNTEVVAVSANSDSNTIGNDVIITGIHVPPASGSFVFKSILLTSATDIFSSAVVGTADLILENCIIAVTNGYLFNVLNWTGNLIVYNLGDASTNNGVVNNTGGATCFFVSATLGNGSGQTMNTTGVVDLQEVHLKAPWNAQTGTVINCPYVTFDENVTLSNDSTGEFFACQFSTGASAALTMSSSGTITLTNSSIDSSNSPSITGAGAGALTVVGCSFLQDREFAGTLTLASGELRGAGQLTRFVVGAAPDAPYQTIQAALDAANAAGGGIVYVQPASYTENLTLYDNTELVGVIGNANTNTINITGLHTPPTSGTFSFTDLRLLSATSIVFSAAVGTTQITFNRCVFAVTNGFVLDVDNWTGQLRVSGCNTFGTNDGFINNSVGTSSVFVNNSIVGLGSAQVCSLNGTVQMDFSQINCDLTISGSGFNFFRRVSFLDDTIFSGSALYFVDFGCGFFSPLTINDTATVDIDDCVFEMSGLPSITQNSSNPMNVIRTTLNTVGGAVITGAGTGVITLGDVVFLSSTLIGGTVTFAYAPLYKSGSIELHGNLSLPDSGNHIQIEGGAVTDFIGQAILVAGTVTIAHTGITVNDRIMLSHEALNASTGVGTLQYTISAGASFTINALDATGAVLVTDLSTISYLIVRQL